MNASWRPWQSIRVSPPIPDQSGPHKRRARYSGTHPRAFHEKYKELNPERYTAEVEKIVASGKTLAGTHRPIMVEEVLECLRPAAGDVAVDCTLGGEGMPGRSWNGSSPGAA